MVSLIETYFIPVYIQNNTGGKDKTILDRYGEPAWNNPVVRFVNSSGGDIISRKGGVYSASGISKRMAEALKAFGNEVPQELL